MTNDMYPNGPPQDTEENANGLRAFAFLRNYLEEDGWHPNRLEEKYIFRVLYSGHNGEIRCYARVRVDLEQFMFYAVAPFKVPEDKRGEMAEYITRANYGLRIGNFEMDYSDGEIRYKTSFDFEGEQLSNNWVKNAIYPAVQTMDRYLPGIGGVLYGGKSAEQAIREIEE